MDTVTGIAKSLTSLAFERLRCDILAGELLPAERLRIQALSERYQVGATAIREALSRLVTEGLVAAEDQNKPLSDSQLSQMLEEQGIQVARRTVAKYREALRIPSSVERKRMLKESA